MQVSSSGFTLGADEADMQSLHERRSLVPETTFCTEHGWSTRALRKACLEKRVFAVEMQGEFYFPAFYLDEQYNRRQLESVCRFWVT